MDSSRVAIDARHLSTGIGAYTKNLISSLASLNYGPLRLVTRAEHEKELAAYSQNISIVNAPIYSISEQITLPFVARKSSLLHVPHYNIPILYSGKLLVTIHDLTHLLFEGYARSWKSHIYGSPMLQIAGRRAAHMFTVSEYSKRTLVEKLDIDGEKITVVYNGVGSQFVPRDKGEMRTLVSLRHGILLPYILYVGSLKPHKNVAALLQAYADLWAGKAPDVDLVIVGKGDEVKSELESLAKKLHIFPKFITDATDGQLVQLYQAAEVLVLPSFEEGFGLPIVEAMACGTPVICANAASMPEIAGEAALLFNPNDFHDLSRALAELLSSSDLRQSLRERGLIRVTQFTWRETAAKHIPVYDKFQS